MKSRFFTLLLCLLAAVAFTGCLGGSSSSDGGASTGTIQGYVTEANGTGIVGATIVSASGNATSGALGYFEIIAPVGRAKITATANTFITSTSFVDVSGTVSNNIVMRSSTGVQSTKTLTDADTTNTQAINDNRPADRQAFVKFPAGSVVKADGVTPADTVKVEIANSVVDDPNYANAFPGYFLGSTGGAAPEPIESFGYLDVNLFDTEDNKLQLGENKEAEIYIPANPDPGAGVTTIPLWRLDEATGIWEQKGNATREVIGGVAYYKANVTTFSTYNLDREFEGGLPLTVTVYDGRPSYPGHTPDPTTPTTPPTPVAGAYVTVSVSSSIQEGTFDITENSALSSNAAWQGRALTDANGVAYFSRVPGGRLAISAQKGDKKANGWSYSVSNGSASVPVYFYEGEYFD